MGDRRGRKLRQKSSGPKGPTRQEGERNLGPQRERTPCEAPKWLPTRNGSWGIEQPSPSPKGEGQWTAGAGGWSAARGRPRHARHAETTGDPRRVAKGSTEDASNSLARKGAPERIVRSCCLEAVLGKNRRTEF